MIEFWVAVVLTGLVTGLTALVDWVVARYVLRGRLERCVRRLERSGLSDEDFRAQVLEENARCKAAQGYSLLLGVDLAAVAIALDTVALGAFLHSPALFPFFTRFDHEGAAFSIPIWVCVFLVHIILLVLSTAIRHATLSSIVRISQDEVVASDLPSWYHRAWRLSSAGLPGFAALLLAISVLANAF